MFLLFHCRFDHNIKYVPLLLKKGGGVYVKGGEGSMYFILCLTTCVNMAYNFSVILVFCVVFLLQHK